MNKKNKTINTTLILVLLAAGMFLMSGAPQPAQAVEIPYPRTANYYLTSRISPEDAAQLAQWDLLILSPQVQDVDPSVFATLRRINPDIIILVYVSGTGVSTKPVSEAHQSMRPLSVENVPQEWDLVSSTGEKVNYWPTGRMLNPSNNAPTVNGKRWNQWLPEFIDHNLYSSGYWDGVFIDEAFGVVSWLNGGDLDFNRDGVSGTKEEVDLEWQEGMNYLLGNLRAQLGSDAIIMVNGASNYTQFTNGRMNENVFKVSDGARDWVTDMNSYYSTLYANAYAPKIAVVNANTSNTGYLNKEQAQFALGSTLLSDGYFSYDFGDQMHLSLWWLDAYNVDLGFPKGRAYNFHDAAQSTFNNGVWVRNFDNGVVVVNASQNEKFAYRVRVNGAIEERVLDVAHADIIEHGQLIDEISPSEAVIVQPEETATPVPPIVTSEDTIPAASVNSSFVEHMPPESEKDVFEIMPTSTDVLSSDVTSTPQLTAETHEIEPDTAERTLLEKIVLYIRAFFTKLFS